jgi:Protein of unknown function (DUF2630)
MAQGVMGRISELTRERERLLALETSHHATRVDHERLRQIDHDLQVLWDLRRRELAGEIVDLDEDYYDRYDINPGDDAPDQYR